MLIDDCEKAELARDFGAFLTQPCTIERRSAPTKDAFGASSATYISTKTMCRVLALKTPREGVQGGQIASRSTQQILLPLNTQISPKDRLVTAGVTFEVIATDQGKTDALLLTVDAAKVP